MPHTEEEQAKIILCGAETVWHGADASRHGAHVVLEQVNLVRSVIHDPSRELRAYLDGVERKAKRIEADAEAIMEMVRVFKAGG